VCVGGVDRRFSHSCGRFGLLNVCADI